MRDYSKMGKLGAVISAEIAHKEKQRRIDTYNSNPNKCLGCNKALEYEKRCNKYCSHSCASTFKNAMKIHDRRYSNCLCCGKELLLDKSYRTRKYCNHSCQMQHKRKILFDRITELGYIPRRSNTGYGYDSDSIGKQYLIATRGHKCEDCGITDWNHTPITLQVDHINGKSTDNRLVNLKLRCPNCHSQTPNYGRKNKNGDREYRREYRRKKEMIADEAQKAERQLGKLEGTSSNLVVSSV